MIILIHVYTHGGWAQRQWVSTTWLTREKNLIKFFLCSWRDSNLGLWNVKSDALPMEAPCQPAVRRSSAKCLVWATLIIPMSSCVNDSLISCIGHIWPAVTKGGQSRWGDHEITGENITWGSFYRYIVFDFFHNVRRLFYYIVTAHSQLWHVNDFKTHFKLQKSTLTSAIPIT